MRDRSAQPGNKKQEKESRKRMTMLQIPQFEKFYSTFVQRMNAVIQHLENYSNYVFLYFNVLDREHDNSDRRFLTNIGLDAQLKFLNQKGFDYDKNKVEKAITTIKSSTIELDNNQLFHRFEAGYLSVEDISIVKLNAYLNGENYTKIQEAEHTLLSCFFDINESSFISIPLIQFGAFEGIVHLIFHSDDKPKFTSNNIGRITKTFSIEFENLLLDWDYIETNINRESRLNEELDTLRSKDYYEQINTSPILKELRFLEYYRDSQQFFTERIKENSKFPEMIFEQQEKIKEYEKKLKHNQNKSIFWDVPIELQTAFQQFLCYFSNYVDKISGKVVELLITKSSNGLKLTLSEDSSIEINEVNYHCKRSVNSIL